jgi:hypothetical protein
MKVPLIISELNTKAVIDTGAEVTVLSESFHFNIPENRRPKTSSSPKISILFALI